MGLCPSIGENQDFLTSDEESGPITLLLTPPELTEEENKQPQEGGISMLHNSIIIKPPLHSFTVFRKQLKNTY